MPLGSKIWLFTKTIAKLERDDYGVYELLDSSDNILYIGYGKVHSSLLKHFADGSHTITGAHNFSVEYTWTEEKSKKRYNEEIVKYYEKHGKYPTFNQ